MRPWYAPGLYWRIQERRRARPEHTPRKPWRQRLRERGLNWTTELVVGAFVAVAAASFASVAFGSPRHAAPQQDAGSAGYSAQQVAAPTPGCIAAPIPGSTRRVCGY